MEYVTITKEAKYAVIAICKEAMVTEYDMILSYPRVIDHIVNIENIKDDQLVEDIHKLGTESLGHFSTIDRIIRNLGGETAWLTSPFPRLVDVEYILGEQLEKEKVALKLYTEARKVTVANKTTVKVGGIFNLFRSKDITEKDTILFEQIIRNLERIISDENRHIRVVEDSIATHKALMRK